MSSPQHAAWFGPLSLVGVALGLVLASASLLVEGSGWAWATLPPLAGAGALAVRGPARQLGVGLVVSALCIPTTLFGSIVIISVLGMAAESPFR